MKFQMVHENLNVLDLEKSIAFYREALGLRVIRMMEPEDGGFKIAFLADEAGAFQLELTWMKGREAPYDLGDNEFHLAFRTDDYEAAYKMHADMDCICYENLPMGIYFISDPDGYWLEIVPTRA
jgi:lactoylglutathione lyase